MKNLSRLSNVCVKIISNLGIGIGFGLLSSAFGSNLTPPVSQLSTQVLPQGVRNLRINNVRIHANKKFDNRGKETPLSEPLNKAISFEDAIDFKGDDPLDKGKLKGMLDAKGFDLSAPVGTTTGDLSVAATATVPVLAWGLTNDFTMALAVPIVNYNVNVDLGFIPSTKTQELYEILLQEGRIYEANKLKEKMRDPIGSKLNDWNYHPLKSESGTVMGDIKLVGKIKVLGYKSFTLSLQPEVSLPTGPKTTPHKVIPTPGTRGPLTFGLSTLESLDLTNQFSIVMAQGAAKGTNRKYGARIPYKDSSKLSPDIDFKTEERPGGKLYTLEGVKYQFDSGFNVITNHMFQYKEQNIFGGNKYESSRYKFLSVDTRQRMHTLQVGIGFNTIGHYKNKSFPIPFEVNLNHVRLLSGKNVTMDPQTTLEFAMFF